MAEAVAAHGFDNVSRSHVRVTVTVGGLLVSDLGSRNGTFVQGRRLTEGEEVAINAGQTIVLGAAPGLPATLRARARGNR